MILTPEALKEAHKHCTLHKGEIEQSEICCCFYCCETFKPERIVKWIEDEICGVKGETALCPGCDIDSVIGNASGYPVADSEFIKAMNNYWF